MSSAKAVHAVASQRVSDGGCRACAGGALRVRGAATAAAAAAGAVDTLNLSSGLYLSSICEPRDATRRHVSAGPNTHEQAARASATPCAFR